MAGKLPEGSNGSSSSDEFFNGEFKYKNPNTNKMISFPISYSLRFEKETHNTTLTCNKFDFEPESVIQELNIELYFDYGYNDLEHIPCLYLRKHTIKLNPEIPGLRKRILCYFVGHICDYLGIDFKVSGTWGYTLKLTISATNTDLDKEQKEADQGLPKEITDTVLRNYIDPLLDTQLPDVIREKLIKSYKLTRFFYIKLLKTRFYRDTFRARTTQVVTQNGLKIEMETQLLKVVDSCAFDLGRRSIRQEHKKPLIETGRFSIRYTSPTNSVVAKLSDEYSIFRSNSSDERSFVGIRYLGDMKGNPYLKKCELSLVYYHDEESVEIKYVSVNPRKEKMPGLEEQLVCHFLKELLNLAKVTPGKAPYLTLTARIPKQTYTFKKIDPEETPSEEEIKKLLKKVFKGDLDGITEYTRKLKGMKYKKVMPFIKLLDMMNHNAETYGLSWPSALDPSDTSVTMVGQLGDFLKKCPGFKTNTTQQTKHHHHHQASSSSSSSVRRGKQPSPVHKKRKTVIVLDDSPKKTGSRSPSSVGGKGRRQQQPSPTARDQIIVLDNSPKKTGGCSPSSVGGRGRWLQQQPSPNRNQVIVLDNSPDGGTLVLSSSEQEAH